MTLGKIVLIPMLLHEDGWEAILPNTIDIIKSCQCFFAENEKTARRYFKKIWKEMDIDAYQWQTIDKVEASQIQTLKKLLQEGKTIGIIWFFNVTFFYGHYFRLFINCCARAKNNIFNFIFIHSVK